MTELLNQEESADRKLEGEELAKAARNLRDQFSLYYKTPILDIVKIDFETNGVKRQIVNEVDGDQQRLRVDAGRGEYVHIWVAKGPSGKNAIDYFYHGVETTHLNNSVYAVREAQGVFAKIFPEGKSQPTRL